MVSAGDFDLLNGWTLNAFNPNPAAAGQRYMHTNGYGNGNPNTTYESDEFIYQIVNGAMRLIAK